MKFSYLTLRLIRHFMPEPWVRFLLRRALVIRPGIETSQPEQAMKRYLGQLTQHGFKLKGKRVLVFGYGGRFALGCELLQAGAAHIILCDPFALPDEQRNQQLLPQFSAYLHTDGGKVIPNSDVITLLPVDVRDLKKNDLPLVNVVLSSSVFEHVADVDGVTQALTRLTKPEGVHLHFVDLRDHYFKYPFEMLTFSERVWLNWLNPSSHHNRFRVWDYQRVFENYFNYVEMKVLARDLESFEKVKPCIRPEFLSGDLMADAVTLIAIWAQKSA